MLPGGDPCDDDVRVQPRCGEKVAHTATKSPARGLAAASIGSPVSVDAFRTPDERFDGIPDFPFDPHYREVDGLRLCHLDEGEGRPVVFFHGEPTWSYLWRKVIPPVRDAGFRCIAPDYAGFGRSDKPIDFEWYTYDRHTELAADLLADLDLRDATVVVHDWGGPIGLRCAVEHPDRISRIVIMDTGLFTGEQPMSDAWHAFRDFVERTEDLPISMLVRNACARGMDRRGRRRLRRAVPDSRVEGRRTRLPAGPADLARHAGCGGRQARARGAARRQPADPRPVGRLRSRASVQGRRGVRRR